MKPAKIESFKIDHNKAPRSVFLVGGLISKGTRRGEVGIILKRYLMSVKSLPLIVVHFINRPLL